MTTVHASVPIGEESQVGEARRLATRLGETTPLDETERGKVAIITTELARNLLKHASGGEMLIAPCVPGGAIGIEMIAMDRGPGMADVSRCLQDGYSTAGTSGTGLGAVRRLAHEFDMFSRMPGGTVIVARVLAGYLPQAFAPGFAAIRVAAPGELVCGDNFGVVEQQGVTSIILADGLGHGPAAAEAADEAVRLFCEEPYAALAANLQAIHLRLRSTRGAAIAVARVDRNARTVKYVGAGNISGWIVGHEKAQGMFSHNGTVGAQMRTPREFDYAWPAGSLIVMHSDGLQSRWSLSAYPGWQQHHPAVIAALLYRDLKRGRDDSSVIVLK